MKTVGKIKYYTDKLEGWNQWNHIPLILQTREESAVSNWPNA